MGILNPPRTIVVPIATDHTHSATLTLPWFVQRATYSPKACAFEALVNGEAAFGAIYDAIEQATTSIDIICWGFQPSMYFKRQYQQSATNLTIGQLLDKKAAQGCTCVCCAGRASTTQPSSWKTRHPAPTRRP